MHFARVLAAVLPIILLSCALAGCGGVSDTPKTVTPPSSTESIKMTLEGVAQSGELGSGGMTLEQEIEKLRTSDPAKADALKSDYEQLKTTNDPSQVKSKAQDMLKKL